MKPFRILAFILPAAYILLYVVLAVLRIGYPFELEWQEGSMVDHVQRVMNGQPLYVAPSVDWVPAIYPPLYYWIGAAASFITGIGFLPLRIISLLASLGCMAILFSFVKRESGKIWSGLLAAGLFAAIYRLGGAWFDLARVDSLFLFFLLAGMYVMRFHATRAGYILTALLAALAVMTKQTALVPALLLFAYGIWKRKEHGLWLSGSLAVLIGFPYIVLNAATDGWFLFYVFEMPAGHSLIGQAFAEFWLHDLFRPLPIAVLGAVLFVFTIWNKSKDRWFYLLWTVGLILAAWLPRVKDGNYANDLMPAYALLALLFGLAASVFEGRSQEIQNAISAHEPARAHIAIWSGLILYGAVLLQFASLYYRPQEQLPTDADRAAGESLLTKIRQFDGEVWIGHHGYLGSLAGKRMYASALPIYDILRADSESAKSLLLNSIEQALKGKRFAAVFTDNDRFVMLNDFREYERKFAVFTDPAVFWPVSGAPTRPMRIYTPVAQAKYDSPGQ
ncbi:hypothetical protein EHM69_00660 [candidate division KSB1 bacterium]|nr:MAG: hypothetical protein EHM69_00660 [candidate division KSB1 bacterium]